MSDTETTARTPNAENSPTGSANCSNAELDRLIDSLEKYNHSGATAIDAEGMAFAAAKELRRLSSHSRKVVSVEWLDSGDTIVVVEGLIQPVCAFDRVIYIH